MQPTTPCRSIASSIPAPPNAPPRFIQVWVSQTLVHGGDVVHAHIRTTSNVASVEVRVANQGISLPRDDYGSFRMDYTVPSLPFFFHGQHAVEIIARNAAGVAVSIWKTFDLE